ncbi:protein DMR6-LIKE OXYGENASE 1-like [Aristolochia californica]|uniref:protein DMR6-LIKE OXYGENASE 1-like n=1 Tax=Aristolochia californica TaxID=171875 RepID=UPI0035D5DF6F
MTVEALKSGEGIEELLSSSRKKVSIHLKYLISDEERKSLLGVPTLTHVTKIDIEELEDGLMEKMMRVAEEFFEMPMEDRAHLYSNDYNRRTRVSTSFNVGKEETLHWRDYLRHPCHPLEDYIDSWPTKPEFYREITAEYATAMRTLTLKLLEAISESLGLEKDYIANALGKQNQTLQINYYPPCPNPDLTLALGAHTDPNCLTVVQHDEVSGLQIMKDGSWLDVPALHGAFFVNIGDQLQVISNGEYKSLVHRAVTNSKTRRISIPSFYGPSLDALIKPADPLAAANPCGSLYMPFTYQEFLDHFYSQRLVTNTLARFKISGKNEM